jgi:hypothetical protein
MVYAAFRLVFGGVKNPGEQVCAALRWIESPGIPYSAFPLEYRKSLTTSGLYSRRWRFFQSNSPK